jgi:hypothetical protein
LRLGRGSRRKFFGQHGGSHRSTPQARRQGVQNQDTSAECQCHRSVALCEALGKSEWKRSAVEAKIDTSAGFLTPPPILHRRSLS